MIKELIARIFYIIPKSPKTAQIGITNKCNFNCKMCQRFDLKVDIKQMEIDTFETIISKLNPIENIILTGWGEPLLHPNLIKMIKLCKAKDKKVRFTSNGALLHDQLIKDLINSGLDEITFSVEEIDPSENSIGHDSSQQIGKIKRFLEINKGQVKVNIQTVLQKDNQEKIIDIAHFCKENKVDRLRLTRLDIRFHDFERPSIKEEKQLVNLITAILKNSKTGIDFLPHTAFDGFTKHIFKLIYPLLHRGGKYCLRTFDDIYINVNGGVTPCCALPKFELGNILDQDLPEVWNSCKFRNFRKHQKEICGKCDILTVKTYNK
ncbi:radical SAM protein [Candidatus Falkowbacteria bacterium]|jgi:MoaA/NifB/PqqE/SkfB family radical SAM enzyme|nr:radical SAM protein [Candidatus Falkowbacteria bacterium]MBT7006872.1 radical SAM protein [Candidatus Falkowbacteria bacterium]